MDKSQQCILIITDIQQDLQILSGALSKYKLCNVNTMIDTLKIVDKTHFELIVLAVEIEDMKGYKLCEQLKAKEQIHPIPIIMVGDIDNKFDKARTFKVGCADYLSKPLHQETVLARIETHLALYSSQQQIKDFAKKQKTDSKFFANMAHELRTPLNAILGHAQIFKRDEDLMEKYKKPITSIHRSGQHLLMIIEDTLNLAKIEVGKMELSRTNFYFRKFLLNIVDMMEVGAQQKGISFIYQAVENDLPEAVWADEKRLRQILLNLLGNAIKFTEKGEVVFSVTTVSHTKDVLQQVRFQIQDTGVGISSEKLKEIFLPFHQASDHHLRMKGSGLGLAISERLIDLMGSKLEVESKVDKGSTFWFELNLPKASKKVERDSTDKRLASNFRNVRHKILLVDDCDENIEVLKTMLAPANFEIAESKNGYETLKIVDQFRPHAILLDLVMPVMDGLECIKYLRQSSVLKDTVIIAISADIQEQKREDMLAAGCNSFLSKPIHMNRLLECLQLYLSIELENKPCSDTQKVSDLPLVALEKQQLEQLLSLVKRHNITGLNKYIAKIKLDNPEYIPFILRIEHFASSYSFKEIICFIESYL